MIVYWGACAISVIIAIINRNLRIRKRSLPLYAFFTCLPLAFISAIRNNVGTDFLSYSIAFERIKMGDNQKIEFLYVLLNKVIQFFNGNYRTLLVVTSLLIGFLFMLYIYLDSPNVAFSVFLYVGTLLYFAGLTNIRQVIGIGFAVLAFASLVRKKEKLFFLLIVIGGLFHYSILLFSVVYFLNKITLSRKQMFKIIGIVFVFRMVISNIIKIIVSYTKYATYFGSKWDDGQVSYAIMSIQFAIFLFSSIYYSKDEKYEAYYKVQFMNVLISIFLGILPLVFRIERIFAAPNIILIPMTLQKIENPVVRFLSKFAIIILFLFYSYISVSVHNQFAAIPYQSIL